MRPAVSASEKAERCGLSWGLSGYAVYDIYQVDMAYIG